MCSKHYGSSEAAAYVESSISSTGKVGRGAEKCEDGRRATLRGKSTCCASPSLDLHNIPAANNIDETKLTIAELKSRRDLGDANSRNAGDDRFVTGH